MSTSPFVFSFDSSFITTAGLLERGNFGKGSYPGLDYPTYHSAVAPYQSISTSGGVDVVAMTFVAGQTYKLDIDSGALDLELDIIDQMGRRIATVDDYGSDPNPFLSYTATRTGTYYIAVHHASNDYIDGSFEWERTPSPTGSYKLAISTPTLPPTYTLTNYSETRTYSDYAQTVKALGGNDTLYLRGGDDIGMGGDGNDLIYGGYGQDELSGGNGDDRLHGDWGDDALHGGAGNDVLTGGSDRDSLNGGTGYDTLYGGTGDDILWGDAQNDVLYGESGNDTLRGGAGIDVMYGGAGADSFHFLRGEANFDPYGFNEDRVQDFYYDDVIDLSDMAWGTLAWRGTGAFTGANQVRIADYRATNGYQAVQVNLDSDSTPEQCILVKTVGNFALIASDFIL